MMDRIFDRLDTIFGHPIALAIPILCAHLLGLGALIWGAFQVSEEDLPIIIVGLVIITPIVIGEWIFVIREAIA